MNHPLKEKVEPSLWNIINPKLKKSVISVLSWLLFLSLLYACYLLVLLSMPYLEFKRNVDFLKTKELIYHLRWWRYSFYIHVFTSPVVIFSGLLQFNKYLIQKNRKIHRTLGYIYFTFLFLFAAPSGLLIGLYANGGYPTQVSFVLLSLCWVTFSLIALQKIKQKSFESHGKWMIRSYALTLSAVTLRFYAYMMDIFHVDLNPITAYTIIAYLSWIPNLILAEILIYKGFARKIFTYFNN
jgi:hypothetical protein